MIGQWLGSFRGERNSGHITLNVEVVAGRYVGKAVLVEQDTALPSLFADAVLQENNQEVRGTLQNFLPIHPTSSLIDSWENVRQRYPNVTTPTETLIEGKIDGDTFQGTWNSNVGTHGEFHLMASEANRPSSYPYERKSWRQYKDYVGTLEPETRIFRGQSELRRLRTSFHRAGRCELFRYAQQDVHILHRYVSSVSRHIFRIENPLEHGALLNLAQHHGYPTPLLDWTKSPYVAAYFAFASVEKRKTDGNVRIFVLNRKEWLKDTQQVMDITSPILSLTILELLAIGNDRMLPQQSVTTFTNVDDVENFVAYHENKNSKKYLHIIELPMSERNEVMQELDYMGINAGSLFPGLDGICRTLREKYF